MKNSKIMCMTIKTHSLHEISFAFFVQNNGRISGILTCCFAKKMYNYIGNREIPTATGDRCPRTIPEARPRGTADRAHDRPAERNCDSRAVLIKEKRGFTAAASQAERWKNNVIRLSFDDSNYFAVHENFRSDERTSSHAAGRRRTDRRCSGRSECAQLGGRD